MRARVRGITAPDTTMSSDDMRVVSCPQCGRQVQWSPRSRYRPFCSERCKLIDLGEWATEGYRIPDETAQEPGDAGEPRGEREPPAGS
jgi:endogenous inhibitor of DNA gyrase (YacG/DUF329 family)